MKLSYEYKEICLVVLVALLIFSLTGCSESIVRIQDQPNNHLIDSNIQTTPKMKVVGDDVVGFSRKLDIPAAMPMGSEKLSSFTTVADWQYAIGTVDVALPYNGACLVTCNIDVQSHALGGYLTFRTARRNVNDGTNESDDGWAMDVPVPISQGSASASYTWIMTGGQTYRFGCRILPDRDFVGIPVYPSISWICR